MIPNKGSPNAEMGLARAERLWHYVFCKTINRKYIHHKLSQQQTYTKRDGSQIVFTFLEEEGVVDKVKSKQKQSEGGSPGYAKEEAFPESEHWESVRQTNAEDSDSEESKTGIRSYAKSDKEIRRGGQVTDRRGTTFTRGNAAM